MGLREGTPIEFRQLISQLKDTQRGLTASAAASVIMQNGEVMWEWYSGNHSVRPGARRVDANSQFNVASSRKTYIAFAVAYALLHGKIGSIDDTVEEYLPDVQGIERRRIRHLLTHTHGLQEQDGKLVHLFTEGTNWQYNNAGVNLLVKIVERTTGNTVAEILQRHALDPLGFSQTGWKTYHQDNLIFNVHEETDVLGPNDSARGDQSNLFTSAREFARWGNLHLNNGRSNGHQLLPASVFSELTTIQSPESLPRSLPTHGFFWWVQGDTNSPMSELGERVPVGAFQVLGFTGCACLVIPALNVVAVRMLNYTGQHQHSEFDYLTDIRQFGNVVTSLFAG